MRLFTISILCLLLSCCTLDWHVDKNCGPGTNRTCGPVTYSESGYSTTVEVYYESCYDEPYIDTPIWCDWYSDNTTCCVWYVDGWYEEWCQWGNDFCWEYNGAW
jgi:hypothetical protein